MKINYGFKGDCRDFLNSLQMESVDCSITSPPYWSLRDYGIEPSIWDETVECDHEWQVENVIDEGYTGRVRWQHVAREAQEKGTQIRDLIEGTWKRKPFKSYFCKKCNAWLGTLGSEPNFYLYVKHLCDVYDLVWKVLKPTGTNWVNLGDTYGGSGNRAGCSDEHMNLGRKTIEYGASDGNQELTKGYEKCLLMLPQRFAIGMIDRGWILRNTIIWHKPNPIPSSARDRFTVDFEYVYFFVKSNKNQYYVNQKSYESTLKTPAGTKGIENIDWEWQDCKKCFGTGFTHKKCEICHGKGIIKKLNLEQNLCSNCNGSGNIQKETKCKTCRGLGKRRHTLWVGYKYFFEPQRDPLSDTPEVYLKKITRTDKSYIKGTQLESGLGAKEGGWNEYLKDHKKELYVPLGKNKRTVWSITARGNPEAHFATFPPKLVEPMIKAGSPKFICSKCGIPRQKIYKIDYLTVDQLPKDHPSYRPSNPTQWGDHVKMSTADSTVNVGPGAWKHGRAYTSNKFMGYSDCGCEASYKPGIVMDMFAGTGTTLLEAWRLGRYYIGCEISDKYYNIMKRVLKPTKIKRLDDFV